MFPDGKTGRVPHTPQPTFESKAEPAAKTVSDTEIGGTMRRLSIEPPRGPIAPAPLARDPSWYETLAYDEGIGEGRTRRADIPALPGSLPTPTTSNEGLLRGLQAAHDNPDMTPKPEFWTQVLHHDFNLDAATTSAHYIAQLFVALHKFDPPPSALGTLRQIVKDELCNRVALMASGNRTASDWNAISHLARNLDELSSDGQRDVKDAFQEHVATLQTGWTIPAAELMVKGAGHKSVQEVSAGVQQARDVQSVLLSLTQTILTRNAADERLQQHITAALQRGSFPEETAAIYALKGFKQASNNLNEVKKGPKSQSNAVVKAVSQSVNHFVPTQKEQEAANVQMFREAFVASRARPWIEPDYVKTPDLFGGNAAAQARLATVRRIAEARGNKENQALFRFLDLVNELDSKPALTQKEASALAAKMQPLVLDHALDKARAWEPDAGIINVKALKDLPDAQRRNEFLKMVQHMRDEAQHRIVLQENRIEADRAIALAQRNSRRENKAAGQIG